jgi:hypothetical protein
MTRTSSAPPTRWWNLRTDVSRDKWRWPDEPFSPSRGFVPPQSCDRAAFCLPCHAGGCAWRCCLSARTRASPGERAGGRSFRSHRRSSRQPDRTPHEHRLSATLGRGTLEARCPCPTARRAQGGAGGPIAFGDSVQGFSVVGTTAAFVDHLSGKLLEGRLFETDEEAVVGAASPFRMNVDRICATI